MSTESGTCQCGNVKVTLTGQPEKQGFCFCSDCTQYSGSIGQFVCMFNKDNVNIEDPNHKVKTHVVTSTDSGKPQNYHFCTDCSCMLYSVPMSMDGGIYGVRPSSLKGVNWKKYEPNFAVHAQERCQWVDKIATL